MVNNEILEGLTILYVEDNELIQIEVTETLEHFGMNVICAKNGQEGIDNYKISSSKIDIILTDIKMPKLDGLSMIKEIRKVDRYTPIIIITAHQEVEFLKSSIELGISSYILKPLDIYHLRDTLIRTIEPIILKNRLLEKKIKHEIQKNKESHSLLVTQSRFATMGEMINMIAHQWRQPLAAIGTASHNLKFKMETNKFDLSTQEGRDEHYAFFIKKLDEIEHYVQNLTTTIDDFRNFYKSDKTLIHKSINEPIENALKITKEMLKENNIKVLTDFQSLAVFGIYENEIMHVVLNLLKNALDHFLEFERQNMKIEISTKDFEDYSHITICDNAGGISEDIIDKIFEPYFSTRKERNGTGIGLYMSKVIIEKHHKGKIYVKNMEEGVCFTIELPQKNQ